MINKDRKIITHKFICNPFPVWKCETIILGTFNPSEGSNADYYYGRTRKKGGWSNRFWPALSSALVERDKLKKELLPNETQKKIDLMREFKFGCIDLIKSANSKKMLAANITGNGFNDKYLFNSKTDLCFFTDEIIEWINNSEFSYVNKIVASWGKGSLLSNDFLWNIDKIQKSVNKKIDFSLFDLPAFGRPLITTNNLGEKLISAIDID